MESFDSIFARAAARKGGPEALEALLPQPKSAAALKRIRDDRYLAEMTACVFRSGFVWQVIENKWPAFETAFAKFDVNTCARLSDEQLERLAEDASIVRNARKIISVRNNAQFVLQISEAHQSFARFVADWPVADIVGLWEALKRGGDRLGGQTGRYLLRFMGKDTPVLSPDVVQALLEMGAVERNPTSRKALAAVQGAFNGWAEQSGRPLCAISRVLACSVGAQQGV